MHANAFVYRKYSEPDRRTLPLLPLIPCHVCSAGCPFHLAQVAELSFGPRNQQESQHTLELIELLTPLISAAVGKPIILAPSHLRYIYASRLLDCGGHTLSQAPGGAPLCFWYSTQLFIISSRNLTDQKLFF